MSCMFYLLDFSYLQVGTNHIVNIDIHVRNSERKKKTRKAMVSEGKKIRKATCALLHHSAQKGC